MQENIEERVRKIAEYILRTGSTVRTAAQVFSVGKSTVHKDMTERLLELDYNSFCEVEKVLQKNKAERHIRGGMATKNKYRRMRHKRTAPVT